jgi:DNA-binding MarR family transcriptional regulator
MAVADRLEELGLIEREPHPTDRRVKNLVLTAKGKRFKKSIPTKIWDGSNTFSALTDGERATLTGLLAKIVETHADND